MLRVSKSLSVVLVLASVACGAGDSPFNVDFFCGWEGCYRPMEWTPVDIGITGELTKPFAGSLIVSAQQDGLNTMSIVHTFVLTPDISLHLPLVTKFAFGTDKCNVRITDERGRTRWQHDFDLWNFSGRNRLLTTVAEKDLLIGLIGSGRFGLLHLPQKSVCWSGEGQGKVYLTAKVPRMVPWDWTGFASLDLLILYDPDWKLFNRHQLNAIAQWVSNGGKLLLVLGNNHLPAENPITQLLPFQVQQIRQITVPAGALADWQLAPGEHESVAAWPLVPKSNARLYDVEKYDSAECLFGTGYVGFGRVGVLAFDPSTLTDRQRVNSAKFWVSRITAILGEAPPAKAAGDTDSNVATKPREYYRIGLTNRSIEFVEDPQANPDSRRDDHYYRISVAQAASNMVMEYLYNIPEMRPLSIWWVILLLTALAVLLGPVDYKILKRKDRLPLTWLTSAGWITLFTVGAYYGVQALRGGKMQMRVVSVLDGIEDSNSTWFTSYSGLFAPYSDDFQLEGLQNSQWWSGIAPSQESIWAYNRQAGTRKIYCFQHDGGNLPYSLPINIWTIQCLLTELPMQQLPFNALVRREGDQIVLDIANESDSPIQSGYVLFANNQAFNFGPVPAQVTKRFEGQLHQQRPEDDYNLLLHGYGILYSYSGQRYRGPRGSYVSSAKLQTANAFLAQGCLQRTQTVNAYLAHGAAVVCTRYEHVPVAFTIKDRSCDYNHIQLVRQVVFPQGSQTRKDAFGGPKE